MIKLNNTSVPNELKLPYEVFLPLSKKLGDDILPGYFISNYSRVYSSISGKILKVRINSNTQYPEFAVQKSDHTSKYILLHRALMYTFYPDHDDATEGNIINHKDGIKRNSFLPNLEFSTYKLNAIHARDNNLLNPAKGENHPSAKITTEKCIRICKMLESQKYRQKEISELCNVPLSVVESIKQGKAWKEISSQYNIQEKSERKSKVFTYDQLNSICRYFQTTPKPVNTSLRKYCKECLIHIGIEISESKLNGIRKLYKKERWKYIWVNYNY